MDQPIVLIVMRLIHVASAIVLVGGWVLLAYCLIPATKLLDESFRQSVIELTCKRFFKFAVVAIVGLLVSGTFNFIVSMPSYKEAGTMTNILIGVKVLLALMLFVAVWAKAAGLWKVKQKAFLSACVHLALLIVVLAGIVRYLRLTYGG